MKKVFRFLGLALLVLIAIVLIKTFTLSSKQVPAGSIESVTVANDVFENLSEAVTYKTISFSEDTPPDSTAFYGFHRFFGARLSADPQ